MPWKLDGTFERINGDFTGNVWTQDQIAGIKVIAARHDVHDADIGTGIEGSLNTNGYNAMLANLDAGGFRVVNMLAGIGALDAVNVTQLDSVESQVTQNTDDIAAINTSDPDSIITAATFDALDLNLDRIVGDFVVPLRRFNHFKAGQIIRHLGVDLVAAAVTAVDTQVANRWYMFNNGTGTMDLNFIRPTGEDVDPGGLGENYFTEGLIIIENGGTPALPTLQGDGVDINPSKIIGSPTLNAGTSYTLSYMIQRTVGDVYRESYIWSAP